MAEYSQQEGSYTLTPEVVSLLESPPPWPQVAQDFFAHSALAAYYSLGPDSSTYAGLNQTIRSAADFLMQKPYQEDRAPLYGATQNITTQTLRQVVCTKEGLREIPFPYSVISAKGVLDPEGYVGPDEVPRGQLFVSVSTVHPDSVEKIMTNAVRLTAETDACRIPDRKQEYKEKLAGSLEQALALPRTQVYIESRLTHFGRIGRGGQPKDEGQVITRLAALNFCVRGNRAAFEPKSSVVKQILKSARPVSFEPNTRRKSPQNFYLWPHRSLQAIEFWRNQERDYYSEHQLTANGNLWHIFPLGSDREFTQPNNLQQVLGFANSFYAYIGKRIDSLGQYQTDSG